MTETPFRFCPTATGGGIVNLGDELYAADDIHEDYSVL